MSPPDRTAPPSRRRRLAGLVAVAFLLGSVATPGAVAQTEDARPDVTQFGGFIVSARGNGLQLTYDSPGLLPTGSPIFQLSVPEALATLNSGPVGYALSSFAFPGPLVADLGAALAAGGQETGIPPYPVRSEAFFPSGPTEQRQGEQGTEMTAITEFADSRSRTSFSGLDFAPAAFVGGARSRAQSVIEGDQIVSRSRSAVSDVQLFGGLIAIDSVVTDIVATSNGTESATAGGTTVSGFTVLGLPATVDADGVRFVDDPADDPGANPVGGPVSDALGGSLDPVQEGLGGVAGPLNALLAEIGATGDDALQELFDQAGIDVRLLGPIETVDGGTAERTANGLSISITYEGRNTPILSDLLGLVPSGELPADDLGPIPLSPQSTFNLLKETHITGVALAPANVATAGTPAFELGDTDVVIDSTPSDGVVVDPSGPAGSDGSDGADGTGDGFETATPDLAPASGGASGSVPASSGRRPLVGDAIPALVVLAVLLGSPFFGAGSRRLADNTLAAAATSCPDGLDLPPVEHGS